MTLQKLPRMLHIISGMLTKEGIPYALIGAFALSLYGMPKYTADIDILTGGRFWAKISSIMKGLGYTCFQKTRSFAQFDSEMGIYGKVDFMLVGTPDGMEILQRSVVVRDDLIGDHPIIQPTDYIILKLMAIANNPDRGPGDEGDILRVLKSFRKSLIPDDFDPIDWERIYFFADRFGQKERVDSIYARIYSQKHKPGRFEI